MVYLLALLSSVLWGSSDFIGGTLSMRYRSALVVGVSQALGLVAITAVALATGAFGGSTAYLPWAVLSGLSGLVGLICFYAALASGTMGVVAPIAALGVVVPVAAGFLHGERPGVLQLAGIVVAIAGVVLASGPELSGRAGPRPLVLAAIAAVGFGFALMAIAEGSRTSTVMTLVAMRVTTTLVVTVALAVALLRGSPRSSYALRGRDLFLVGLLGLGDVSANLAFGIASSRGLVSVVAVLGSLYPVMTVLMARLIHGERLGGVQTAGVVGALSGVVLIAAG